MCMFSFTADGFNVFELADTIRGKGFYMQPQFSHGQTPANLHVSLNGAEGPRGNDWGKGGQGEGAGGVVDYSVRW